MPAPTAADPVEKLSQESGVSAEALRALSPAELNGMRYMEQSLVAAKDAVEAGRMPRETYDAAVVARDGIRARVEARVAPAATPSAEQEASGVEALQVPTDARLSIRGDRAVFDVNIHLFGPTATPEMARAFERQIQHDWGQNPATGDPWTYTNPDGRTYTVQFDVDVDVVSIRRPADRQALIDRGRNPGDHDNYIEVVDEARAQQLARSGDPRYALGFRPNVYDLGGNAGRWRGYDTGGTTMAQSASHEFGHLLGFRDRYHNETRAVDGRSVPVFIPDQNYEHNIMGTANGGGRVTQRMIDNLMHAPIFKQVVGGTDLPNESVTGPMIE